MINGPAGISTKPSKGSSGKCQASGRTLDELLSEASETLRRRVAPRSLGRALDAVYRAESAWKGGRADAVAVLEQATREVCEAQAGA